MKRVALLGMPNTGKSTLFNRLTGASTRVGNWPGITVDILSAKLFLGGHITEIVDLPGIYDLHGFSEDEQVVRHFLTHYPVNLIIIVLNSVQIERQLSLALAVKALGVRTILALNMSDEAKQAGISIDSSKMTQRLMMSTVQISAKYGDGIPKLLDAANKSIAEISTEKTLAEINQVLESDIQIEKEIEAIVKESIQTPVQITDETTNKLDSVLLHPWFGLPLFFLAIFLLFQFIFTVGTPLQDGMAWIFDTLRASIIEPLLSGLPAWLSGLLLDGIYNGISTVASFVPVIVIFFLVMSLVEDSGYLSRAAFLMDAIMARLGLDGRGFVMVLMGFGCNVPALMGTRIMRSRAMRLLTMLTIPFSLCSARLQVFLFLITIFFSGAKAGLMLFALYSASFFAILLTAVIFKGQYKNNEPFILELPPYRLPTPRQIWQRGWLEVKNFLKRATKFIILGVVLVWLLTHIPTNVTPASSETWAGQIGTLFQPILAPIGIDAKLAIALIFGFVAKEIVIGSLAVIYNMQGDALAQQIGLQLDWVQAMSFMLFTLIYTPCLSTIAALRSESKSNAFTWLSIGWSLALAWVVSFVFYQSARFLGY